MWRIFLTNLTEPWLKKLFKNAIIIFAKIRNKESRQTIWSLKLEVKREKQKNKRGLIRRTIF